MLAAKKLSMRDIKLSGREAAVVRAIGFAESMLGAEILDSTRMEPEDVGDTLNGLIAAGFVETIPYAEQIDLAEMPSTAFEVNPAYVHELRTAISRRSPAFRQAGEAWAEWAATSQAVAGLAQPLQP